MPLCNAKPGRRRVRSISAPSCIYQNVSWLITRLDELLTWGKGWEKEACNLRESIMNQLDWDGLNRDEVEALWLTYLHMLQRHNYQFTGVRL